jgi:hypothetical protein
MKNVIFPVMLLLSLNLFAQDDKKNPNVELPDFVIMGKDVVSIRAANKINPDYTSTVSDDYLKPLFAPDQLEVVDFSNPNQTDLNLLDSVNYYKGYLSLKSGRYTLPAGELNYSFPFDGGSLQGIVFGDNQLAYDKNTDNVKLGGLLNLDYTTNTSNSTLPGTKFSIGGRHTNKKYNLFGSSTPEFERTLNAGNAYFDIQNLYMRRFIFDAKMGGDFTYLDKENLTESVLNVNLFGKLNLTDVGIGVKSNYQKQYFKNDFAGKIQADYYMFRPTAYFKLFNSILTEAGFTFSGSGNNTFHRIFVSLSTKLADQLVLMGEYNPGSEFLTASYFLRNNEYLETTTFSNFLLKKKNQFKVALKYEYDKYFQIDGGIKYFSSSNYPFYSRTDSSGLFNIDFTDVKNYDLFANFLFHYGPYGVFYASVDLFKVNNSAKNKIPYQPEVITSFSYGYDFQNGLSGKINLEYQSKRYTNLENTTTLGGFFNAGVELEYRFGNNISILFQLNNLLNQKIYFWEGYKRKPLDAVLGINFLFN